MRRNLALIGVFLICEIVIAQSQAPANSESTSSGASGQSSNEHIQRAKEKGIKAPKVKYWRDPKMPKNVKGMDGKTVVLWCVIGSDGLPHDIKVARVLQPDMDEAAVEAVKDWRFAPATKAGKPVPVQINIEVVFQP
jgi:TonB family protein